MVQSASAQPGPLFIGIDVGTSSVKAVMGGLDGEQLDSFSAGHETQRPKPGAAEQDPDLWLNQVNAALSQFAQHRRAGDVVAIGVTSQVNTHIFCNEELEPLRPALTWQDTRPGEEAAQLDARISQDEKIAALGAPIPIDASHALSRMAWVAAHEPENWEKTTHVLLPKDWVIARLTGEVRADPISSIGLVGEDHSYADPVLNLFPRAEGVLPSLTDPLSVVGTIRNGQPFAGVPVCSGTMDAWASMFGLGVASEMDAMYLSGTSEVLGLISAKGTGAPGIITFPSWRGIRLHAGPTQSGGSSLNWASNLLGHDINALLKLVENVEIRTESPLFLPHLEGERAPLWDPNARGAFAGLAGASGPADIVASVMEGVAFSARLAIEAIEESGAQTIHQMRHGGGGSQADIWCQIRANVLCRPLERVTAHEAGAMGAMVMAGAASGAVESLQQAAQLLVTSDRLFEPDLQHKNLFDDRFAAYRELYSQLVPIHQKLTGTG